MDLSIYFTVLVAIALLICGATATIISIRQRRSYEKLARTETFHCLRCDSVYTAQIGSESQVCPKCGYKNTKLKF